MSGYADHSTRISAGRKLLSGFFLLLLTFSLAACASGSQPPSRSISRDKLKSIKVVMDNNYPPYAFLDENGKLQGILVDQWHLWEQKTGIEANLVGLNWSEAQRRMAAGEFDVIDTIFFNENRARLYDFSEPYATLEVPIYFNNKITGITGPESLKGFEVAVKSDDAVIEILKEKGIEKFIEFPSYEAIINAAKDQEIMVFAVDAPPAEYFLYRASIQNKFNKTTPLYSGQFHRAVKKGDTAMLKIVQDGFNQISDKELSEIDAFWIGTRLINTNDLKAAGIVGGVILAILLVLVAWNRTLHFQVERKTRELSKQETLFQQLTENIEEVFYMRDRKSWRTIYANPTFETVWHRSRQELYTNPDLVIESIHPEDRERVQKAQKNLQISGTEYAETYRILRPDGSQRWIKAQMYPVSDEKGAVVRFAGIAEDITERKHAEETLIANEKRYQDLMENLGLGICILDPNYNFSYVNPAGCEIFGIGAGGMTGQPASIFLTPEVAAKIPATEFFNNDHLSRATEVEIIRTDQAHRILQVTVRKHTDSDGKPNGFFCSFHDITERKKAEEILRKSEERFRYIFEQVAVGFAQVESRTGRYVRVNQKQCDILGYTSEELLHKTYKDITFPDDLGKEVPYREKFLKGEIKVYSMEKRYLRKDGNIVWVNITVSSMWEQGEDPAFDIAVVEDITERKNTEAALEKSRQQLLMAIEGSGVGIWDWIVETKEMVINDRWADMIGYTREELDSINLPYLKNLIEPNDFERATTLIGQHMRGQLPHCEFEMRLRHKDGQWVWVLAHCKVTQWDEKGQPARVTGTHLDISQRKKTEEAIRENEYWLRESQRVGRIGSYVMDLVTEEWFSSPVLNDLFGIEDSAPKYIRTWEDIIHPDDREMMLTYFSQHVIGEGQPFDKEYRIIRIADGQERWMWGRGELAFDQFGNAVRMIGTIQDITEQKNADEVLWRTTQELQIAYDATLQGWSNALELRERETAGHSKRVVELTLDMARSMNFSEEEIIHVQRGALLHDIGKMGIPDSILLKPGPLSEDEWVIMRQHPIYAYRLLSKIPYLRPALDIPYYHHEHFDGRGYPCGLKGNEIPLAARIFTIVDVWDALLSDRPYRPAWTEEAVVKYLRDQSGKQFDPELVEKFCRLISS
jgi:PAS domain S-box-containing protein